MLLNGCLSEFPARHIIYSTGCLANGNSRNKSSYQTVLEKHHLLSFNHNQIVLPECINIGLRCVL